MVRRWVICWCIVAFLNLKVRLVSVLSWTLLRSTICVERISVPIRALVCSPPLPRKSSDRILHARYGSSGTIRFSAATKCLVGPWRITAFPSIEISWLYFAGVRFHGWRGQQAPGHPRAAPFSFTSEFVTMSEFQVLAIPVYFVLCVGIIKILDSGGAAIRRREQPSRSWRSRCRGGALSGHVPVTSSKPLQ